MKRQSNISAGNTTVRADLPGLLVEYLKQSHIYYRDTALVKLENDFAELLAPCSQRSRDIFRQFFSVFKDEMEKHFLYEEEILFPYVEKLIAGKDDVRLEDSTGEHSNMQEKLSDLHNLVLKSMPPECDNDKHNALLDFLAYIEKDIACHTSIEDDILIPLASAAGNTVRSTVTEVHSHKTASLLSEREKEILISVAQGKINKEIADEHNISVHTVISHRKNITNKTGIKTVSGLTAYAILNNLIDINTIE